MSIHTNLTNPRSEITQNQKEMLFFIYEEGKLARDVYMNLAKIYKNEDTFLLMQVIEKNHMDLARDICNAYGVETSSVYEDMIGKFDSPVLQTLYDSCIETGSRSLHDALEVCEFIELTDIEDLEHASIGMPNNVVSVYNNLKKGNLNQLDFLQSVIYRAA